MTRIRHGGILKGKDNLHQGLPVHAPPGAQLIDNLLEGNILVRVSFNAGLPRFPQELLKGAIV